MKAKFCRQGLAETQRFCAQHGLPFQQPGKLIVATSDTELHRMQALYRRCQQNGLAPRIMSRDELREREPAVDGLGAILVRESAITDYPAICSAMVAAFIARGGETRFGHVVSGLRESADRVLIEASGSVIEARQLVVCGGLMSDRLARMQGLDIAFRILPFRGEYFRLRPGLENLVRHLIYPVPDPALPFLGIHLTPTTKDYIMVGPNAVQGWKREGYGRFNFNLSDSRETLGWPGFWRLSRKHLAQGVRETAHSLWKHGYLSQVRRYCPQLDASDLQPHPAGVRAQAVLADGTMVHDFLLERTPRTLHVCNAPSPAATSAIPIAHHIGKLLTS